jgi:hypothetical protein
VDRGPEVLAVAGTRAAASYLDASRARNDGANTAFVTFDHGVMVPQEQPGVTMIPAASGFSPRFAMIPIKPLLAEVRPGVGPA